MEGENLFAHIQYVPPPSIPELAKRCSLDPSPEKVNLSQGAYRTNEGNNYVFNAVKEAERRILSDPNSNKEYSQPPGLDLFCKLACELILGKSCPALLEDRVVTYQTISGTGALKIGLEFIKTHLNPPAIYVSEPTWPTHNTIVEKVGIPLRTFPYWNQTKCEMEFDSIISALSSAPKNSVIILHACAHNPTGIDPTREQWSIIEQVMKEKQLIPFFDAAYLGWATGDYDEDAYVVRKFVNDGFQCFISQSFAKNMGIYGERTGTLHIICANKETAVAVHSNIYGIVFTMYLNPPIHGAMIVIQILSDPELDEQWKTELRAIVKRLKDIRVCLVNELNALIISSDFSFVARGAGMFSLLNLTPEQCDKLLKDRKCYLPPTGRIALCGVNTSNVAYLAKSIKEVVDAPRED